MRRLLAGCALLIMMSALGSTAVAAQNPPPTTTSLPGGVSASTAVTRDVVDSDQRYFTLDSASPSVAPDGTWTATWSVAQEPPADAELQYTIHQPLAGSDLPDELGNVLGGGQLGPGLQREVDTPVAQLRTGSKVTLDIATRSHSGPAERVLIPNPGILPIDIDLVTSDGTRLQHNVLFLDRLPVTATHPALRVAPRAEAISTTPVVGADGTTTVPAGARQSVDALIELLRHAPAVPVTATIDPELLDALKSSSDTTDAQRATELRNVLRAHAVLRSPWAPLNLDSWASSGTLADLQTSLLVGQTVAVTDGGTTTENRIWPPDTTIGPGAVRALQEIGVQHLVLNPDQLEPTKEPPSPERVAVQTATSGLDALVDDPMLTAQLRDTTVTAGTSAHLLATELEAIWFSTPAGVTPAVSLDLSAAPADTANAVLGDLAGTANPTIKATTLTDAFAAASLAQSITTRRHTTPTIRRLVTPSRVEDVGSLSSQLGQLRTRAAAYHSSMRDQTGVAPLNELLLESQHRSLSIAQSQAYLDAAAHRIASDFAKIQPPPPRSLTLTARSTTLLVRIVSGVDREVTVRLRFRGTRLGLRDGATRAVPLHPGPNSVKVPVVVRTSGDFTMTIEIRTADNALLLSETTVRIRSTVVSGVGVLLGGGALLFLVIWWGATIRRDRRIKTAARHPTAAPTGEPASLA